MKNIKLLAVLSWLAVMVSNACAQTIIWTEDFNDATQYSVTLGGEGNDGTADYFQRTDGTNINKTYSAYNGTYFFAGQDIDDGGWAGSASPSQLTWQKISINQYTGLQFKGLFASAATTTIDNTDYLHVEYRIDGGAWTNLIWFENDGSTYNTFFLEDTNFDGVGDGTQLISTMTEFVKSISATGDSIEIRFTAAVNSGDEDFGIDYFRLEGTAVNPVDFQAETGGADQIDLSWKKNTDGDDVMVAYTSDGVFGTPVDGTTYAVGSTIPGGGEVIYNGSGTTYSHTGLTADTRYFYKAWSVDPSANYSSGVVDDTTTLAAEPTADPTVFTAVADNFTQISLTWTDTPTADSYLVKGSATSYASITDPTDGKPESDAILVKNVAAGIQTCTFAGLNASTTYYFQIYPYNGDNGSVNYKTSTPQQASATTSSVPNAWINEFHYDNDGTDTLEFVEIIIENPGSYALSDFRLDLYNGSGGTSYDNSTVDGFTSGDTSGTFYFFYKTFATNGIQNGAPDGLSLSYQGAVIPGQFLSYEGTFTATDGPASGLSSTDVGVSETSTTPVGESLQLKGGGDTYSLFSWQSPATSTRGSLNNRQYLGTYTTWTGATDTVWTTSSNWNNGVPTSSFSVIIPQNATNFPHLTAAASCDDLIVESDANGDASLLGDNYLTVNGTATVERYLTGDRWHSLSASTQGQTLNSLFFDHDPKVWVLRYNEPDTSWIYLTALTTPMDPGSGFLVWIDSGYNVTARFTGNLQTGDLTLNTSTTPALSYTVATPQDRYGFNLIGNPFASAIDLDRGSWSLTDVSTSFWVWDPASGSYKDWNTSSSTGSLTGGIVPMGQGFFIQATGPSPSITIPVAARLHSSQAYYQPGRSPKENEPLRFTLKALADAGSDEINIAFLDEATDGFDTYDTRKMLAGGQSPALFVVLPGEKLGIAGQPPLAENGCTLTLGYRAGVSGEQQLVADLSSLPETEVLLADRFTGTLQSLRENPVYSFTSEVGDLTNRFLLYFEPLLTGMGEGKADSGVTVYAFDKTVYVRSEEATGTLNIRIYDLLGRKILEENRPAGNTAAIDVRTSGYLVVTVTTDKGVLSRKVYVR